jgi:hypothetical protein
VGEAQQARFHQWQQTHPQRGEVLFWTKAFSAIGGSILLSMAFPRLVLYLFGPSDEGSRILRDMPVWFSLKAIPFFFAVAAVIFYASCSSRSTGRAIVRGMTFLLLLLVVPAASVVIIERVGTPIHRLFYNKFVEMVWASVGGTSGEPSLAGYLLTEFPRIYAIMVGATFLFLARGIFREGMIGKRTQRGHLLVIASLGLLLPIWFLFYRAVLHGFRPFAPVGWM